MSNLLIVGTDTGVGKTILTAALAAYALRCGERVAIVKCVQCGPGDGETYRALFGEAVPVILPQVFAAPLAPPLAAEREGSAVDLARLWQCYSEARALTDWVLVEGVGGVGCPLTLDATVADLGRDWRIPAVLVAPVRLGAVGQIVAAVGYSRAVGLDLRAIVLSRAVEPLEGDPDDLAPVPLIENLCRLPVLGTLPRLSAEPDQSVLAAAAAGLWLEGIGLGSLALRR